MDIVYRLKIIAYIPGKYTELPICSLRNLLSDSKKISCFPVKAEKGRSSSTVSESESAVSQTHHYYVYPLWISKLRSITISLIRSTITNEWSNKRTRHIWSNHVHPVLSVNSCSDCLPASFTCCVHIIILLISSTHMPKNNCFLCET